MAKTDRQLGMGREITRRDFIHDLSFASLVYFTFRKSHNVRP